MSALRKVVNLSQIVFGSDYPYLRRDLAIDCRRQIEASPELTDEERASVLNGTAMSLLPRLATALGAVR